MVISLHIKILHNTLSPDKKKFAKINRKKKVSSHDKFFIKHYFSAVRKLCDKNIVLFKYL